MSRDKQDWISKKGTILSEGYIALQAEGQLVDFKNFEIIKPVWLHGFYSYKLQILLRKK